MTSAGIDLDEELLQEFHTEVADIMDGLGDDLMSFEEQIDNLPQELIGQIFRSLHTIKGNAGFVGLTAMSTLAHAMEDIFAAVRNGTLQIKLGHMDHLFSGLDTLKEMLREPIQSSSIDTTSQIKTYKAIIDGSFDSAEKGRGGKTQDAPVPSPLLEKFLQSDDLIEQIDLLQEIENTKLTDAIPALWEFIEHPFADDPLNVILDSVIKELLNIKRDSIIEGLAHPGIKVQTLCAQLAGKYQLKAALPALQTILKQAGATAPTDPELLRVTLKSLGELQDPAALELLKPFCFNDDPVIASTAVASMGQIQPELYDLRDAFERLPEIPALAMLNAMAAKESASNTGFLTNHIHHPNSIIRREVADHIIKINEPAIAPLVKKLTKGDRDEKIMAANILAHMDHQEIFPYLVITTRESDVNIRFAAYEALGNISSSQTCYTCYDGVYDPDIGIRTLVLTYLEENICAVAAGKIRRNLQKNDEKAERIREAMTYVAATAILERLIDYEDLFPPIFKLIRNSSSTLVQEQYKSLLLKPQCKRLRTLWDNTPVDSTAANAHQDLRILVVDDSPAVLRMSANILNKRGYTTFTAMDGQQGLNILAKHEVDIVLTDLNMPVKNGIELAREIRNDLRLQDLPLIMITTEQNDNEKQAARDAGINIFLTKPFKPKELLECIDSLLQ